MKKEFEPEYYCDACGERVQPHLRNIVNIGGYAYYEDVCLDCRAKIYAFIRRLEKEKEEKE